MSKNKNKNNQNPNTTADVEAVDVVEEATEEVNEEVVEEKAPVEETPAEVTEEVVEETVEAPVEEPTVEETVEEEPVLTAPEFEAPVEEPTPVVEPVKEVKTATVSEGHFYVFIGKDLTDEKLKITEDRLEKAGVDHIVTAEGEVMVGPFDTREDVITVRKKIMNKGLKGSIIEA